MISGLETGTAALDGMHLQQCHKPAMTPLVGWYHYSLSGQG